MFGRTIRIAIAALSFGIVPTYAFADNSTTTGAQHQVREGKAAFPVSAEKFSQRVQKHIARARERLVAKLDKHNVSDERKNTVLSRFDSDSKLIVDAAAKAGADGTVTKEKAEQVRALSKTIRAKARADLHPKGAAKKS